MGLHIRRRVSAGSLIVAAGLVASAAEGAIFTFTQQCASPTWYGECTGAPCVPSGINTFNNWGQTGCAAGLPLPGPLDSVVLDGATVNLNGSASVLSFTTNASTDWSWSAGNFTVAQASASSGSMTVSGASNRSLSGAITNLGTWSEDTGGFVTNWSTASLTNNGTLTLAAQSWSRAGSTNNSFTNSSTFNKVGPANSTITSIALNQNGTMNVQGGSLTLTGTFGNVFGPGSSTNTSPGASLLMTTTFLSGDLSGTNAGTMGMSSPTLTGNLTVDVTGNPIAWTAGNLSLASNTLSLSAATGIVVSGAVNRNISGGTVINDGTWTDATGGFTTFMSSVALTNNGTYTCGGQQFTRVGSSANSITNNGTFNKTSATTSTIASIGFTQNGILNVEEGTLTLTGTFPNVFAPTSTTNTSPGATLTFSNTGIGGTLQGDNNGAIVLITPSLADNLTLDPSGNPIAWTGGNLGLGGRTLTIGSNASVVKSGAVSRNISGGILINNGSWTDDTGGFNTALSTAAITNNGVWNCVNQNYSRFGSSTNSLTNNGTFIKSGAGSSLLSEIPIVNNGLLAVEGGNLSRTTFAYTQNASGTTRVHAGATTSLGGSSWNGGRLEGLGTIGTSNSFVFSVGPVVISPGQPGDEGGTLTLSGGTQIVMTADDTLDIELDARPSEPGGSDRLLCSHTVSAGGATLRVSLAPGFIPTLGDEYEVLRTTIGVGTPIVGTFNPVFDVPSGVTFSIQYFPQVVRLTVTGTICDGIDFNNDASSFDPQDIDAFLSVFSEGPCLPESATCNDIDFNNDASLFDPCDITSFLTVYAEGPCSPCGE